MVADCEYGCGDGIAPGVEQIHGVFGKVAAVGGLPYVALSGGGRRWYARGWLPPDRAGRAIPPGGGSSAVEVGQIQFIIAWVSILVTILGAVLAGYAFLHREMRDGFKRQDERMDGQDAEIKELRTDVGDLRVSVARIAGHLGIGFPRSGADEPTEPSERPDRAA